MKKAYVAPKLNASMNGTLEGVYACTTIESNKDYECGGYFISIGCGYDQRYDQGCGGGYGYGRGRRHH
ncbi:hypothetical protein [Butyrivibrio sp. XPD2006]|uniref:hypothetical protein n=1 Tax=Butyrivibrio sp. XPD2006 TaxID=1280668 RepID=UPI0003B579C7|nr:hypothetical protein [Butyrivibrio sp. XPD2006]